MNKVLIINAHQPYAFSPGKLNASLVERMTAHLQAKGYELRVVKSSEGYDPQTEVENHLWADVVIVQTPVNWMGVPWSFKKYMDEVYSAGMVGQLCDGDGRSRKDPSRQYGQGGKLTDTKYMLSLTFNAPRESFGDPSRYLFQGRGVDDLFWPMHLNFRFFGMSPLETFVCHDVLKNPDIEGDFARLEAHLDLQFPAAG